MRLDLTGQRFGRLVAMERQTTEDNRHSVWLCQCDCGKTKNAILNNLRRGLTKSCGCLSSETTALRNTTHGSSARKTKTPEYRAWSALKNRCNNPNNNRYHVYGGRGISFCKEWESFEQFLSDMGPRPAMTSIDRIDNNKGYSKENCRWATIKQQMRNTTRCRPVTYEGCNFVSITALMECHGITEHVARKIANGCVK